MTDTEDSRELLREQRRIRRKLKKEEKRKENDSKKLNLNPQDTHVTIIRRDFASSLRSTNIPPETQSVSPTLREDDFPCLGQKIEHRSRSRSQHSNETEHSTDLTQSEIIKKDVRLKKSKAPVVLNIEEMIRAEPNPFITTLKQNMSISNVNKSVPSDKFIIGGNVLDSSQPVRKRQKQREVPKPKKLNNFKTAILKEREHDKDIISSMDIICDNVISDELDSKVETLVNEIVTFQEKMYKRNPIKGSSKRRYVAGFHEVKKLVSVGKIKLIIFAPNLNITNENSILVQTVNELKTLSNVHDSQYIFALSRRKLGRLVLKSVPVSCIGILNYSGAENTYKQVIELMESAKQEFQMTHVKEEENDKSITHELSEKLLHVLKVP